MWCEEDIYPDYYYEDPDYEDCEGLDEVMVLRLLKTYHELVAQRYTDPHPFPYTNFKLNRNNRQLRLHGERYYTQLIDLVEGLLGRDPAHFVAFVFENWGNRQYYHIFKWLGFEEKAGLHFPSIRKMLVRRKDLVQIFMANPDYKPTQFIPADDLKARRTEAVEERMRKWCSAHDKTPWDYWSQPQHLHPNYISARDLDYSTSFWEQDEKFQEHFGVSATDIRGGVELYEQTLEQARQNTLKDIQRRRSAGEPIEHANTESLLPENFLDEYTIRRIDYIKGALMCGVDITTEEFEREMEDVVNPIDFDHPDTVMYYHYGIGDGPRRKYDGGFSGE